MMVSFFVLYSITGKYILVDIGADKPTDDIKPMFRNTNEDFPLSRMNSFSINYKEYV